MEGLVEDEHLSGKDLIHFEGLKFGSEQHALRGKDRKLTL
jgi:hypothetical protein